MVNEKIGGFTELEQWMAFNKPENIYRYIKAVILKDSFYIEVRRWFKDQGDSKLRLNYPKLNKDSIVFDVGGYLVILQIQKKLDV